MKNCKSCGKEVNKNVYTCPNCGVKLRKPIYKRIWFWGIIVLFVVVAYSNSKEDPKLMDNKVSKNVQDNDKDTKQDKKNFKIGDTVKLKDYKVTVNSIRRDNGGEISNTEEGNEILYTDLTIENISNDEKNLSSVLMFTIVDNSGRKQEQAIFANTKGSIDGTIGPGRKLTGEYAVETAVGSEGLELVFDGDFLSSGQIIISLK